VRYNPPSIDPAHPQTDTGGVYMTRRFPWIKYIAGITLFAFWHQLYDLFPSTWAAILAEGEQESIFAHMKMLFYPYLILSIADYILLRRKGKVPASFVYARLLILVSAPWIMMSIWYVPDALGISMDGAVELIYSILLSFVGVYLAIRMEAPLEATRYRLALKILLLTAFLSALITYTGFSLHLPHYGFFVI
jgi:hypothetical protein